MQAAPKNKRSVDITRCPRLTLHMGGTEMYVAPLTCFAGGGSPPIQQIPGSDARRRFGVISRNWPNRMGRLMKLTGKMVGAAVVLIGAAAIAGCTPSPSQPKAAAAATEAVQKFELIEIIARPAGEPAGAFTRPAHPADKLEIAIRTQGATKQADLAVKMIALADGTTVDTRTLRLNAGNSAAPQLTFEPSPQWSTGRYLFEVTVDGKLAGSQELEIFPSDIAAPAQ